MISRTKAEREAYNRRLKIQRDNYAADEFARKKAIAEGLAEGLAEGHAKGLAEGRAEGRIEIAKRLLAMGLTIEQVAEGTGLSVKEVEALG